MKQTLLHLFSDKLIPWAESGLEKRLVVARDRMKQASLPEGFEINPYKPSGKRVPVRGKRHSGYRLFYAEWPEDHLQELTAPKLVCVTKGITDFIAGKYIISCGEGKFILVPPFVANVADTYRPNLEGKHRQDGYGEMLQILVGKDTIQCAFSIHTKEESRHIQELSCSIINDHGMRLFREFWELAQDPESCQPQLQQHLLCAFFWIIFQELKEGHEFYPVIYNHFNQKMPQTVGELYSHIKSNLRHQPTIEKIARDIFMSPRQFTRYLRREADKSFVEILTECRLEEAKRFLIETTWTIDGIAWMVGFKSAAYFNTFFSRHVGSSPGVYRQKTSKNTKLKK